MKNPFVQMAVIAAAMMAAFSENAARDSAGYNSAAGKSGHPGSKKHYHHQHNPTGSKFLRRAYKAKTGLRGTYREAAEWYAQHNPKAPS